MSDKLILKKDYLTALLRKLSREYRLVAPVTNRHGDTMFTPIDDLDATPPDLENQPQNSLKEFLLPQQEALFTYENTPAGDYSFSPATVTAPPTIFFGVRACDLSAVLYMDVIFQQGKTDPYYLEKRKNSLLIGLNCNKPFADCFCNATGHGPFLEYGFDLQFTDLGDRFLVEVGRSRGGEIVRQWRYFFTPADGDDRGRQYQALLEARGGFRRMVHVDQAIRRLRQGKVDDSVWHELSRRCQDCGGCAYVCPTCTCFTIIDRPVDETRGERVRMWDACTFSGFTGMAGGHNPVDPASDAVRRRFMHKLVYDVNEHGRPSCVGCGRCVGICFGGTDMVRFIDMAGGGGGR